MDMGQFQGKWKRIVGPERFECFEIDEGWTLKDGHGRSLGLHLDEDNGALVDEARNVSVSYWKWNEKTLLFGTEVTPGDGWPWIVWGGELTQAGGFSGQNFHPSLKAVKFLSGAWRVRAQRGDPGGRTGGYVMVVAGRPEAGGDFPSNTRFWLCHSEQATGPWIRYDVMRFNSDTGSLDSVDGHRSISYLERSNTPERIIYAMYYRVPAENLMPFEAEGEDGTGTWGAEGG
jgi:hypothetical protein